MDRRSFIGTILSAPAALALVDVRKMLPTAPEAAKVFGLRQEAERGYFYVRAEEPIPAGQILTFTANGDVRGIESLAEPVAGVSVGSMATGQYGWIQVSGLAHTRFKSHG